VELRSEIITTNFKEKPKPVCQWKFIKENFEGSKIKK